MKYNNPYLIKWLIKSPMIIWQRLIRCKFNQKLANSVCNLIYWLHAAIKCNFIRFKLFFFNIIFNDNDWFFSIRQFSFLYLLCTVYTVEMMTHIKFRKKASSRQFEMECFHLLKGGGRIFPRGSGNINSPNLRRRRCYSL